MCLYLKTLILDLWLYHLPTEAALAGTQSSVSVIKRLHALPKQIWTKTAPSPFMKDPLGSNDSCD